MIIAKSDLHGTKIKKGQEVPEGMFTADVLAVYEKYGFVEIKKDEQEAKLAEPTIEVEKPSKKKAGK